MLASHRANSSAGFASVFAARPSVHRGAQRPRAKLPGGSGLTPSHSTACRRARQPHPKGPARRVSFSELLGSNQSARLKEGGSLGWG